MIKFKYLTKNRITLIYYFKKSLTIIKNKKFNSIND